MTRSLHSVLRFRFDLPTSRLEQESEMRYYKKKRLSRRQYYVIFLIYIMIGQYYV